jgi:hypothetical protein
LSVQLLALGAQSPGFSQKSIAANIESVQKQRQENPVSSGAPFPPNDLQVYIKCDKQPIYEQ